MKRWTLPLSQHTRCGASSSFSAWSPPPCPLMKTPISRRKKEHPLEWNSRFSPPTHFAQTYLLSADYSHARLSMSLMINISKAFDIVTTNTIVILLEHMGMQCITYFVLRNTMLSFVCLSVTMFEYNFELLCQPSANSCAPLEYSSDLLWKPLALLHEVG